MRKLEAVDRVNFSGFITALGGDIEVLTIEELLSLLCSHPPELRGPTPVSPSRVSVVPALVSGAVHRPPQGEIKFH